jgi:pimeloyl-ACP methyl ester carboxylesterase
MTRLFRLFPLFLFLGLSLLAPGAEAACGPDRVQASGAIYRICMPPAGRYNGRLVVWAHGFQDAGTPVSIPEQQLKAGNLSLPDLVNGLGFGFATTSYARTGLAVRQGMADLLDLVSLYRAEQGTPAKVYLTGASEGGLITALLAERHPEAFSGALAVCGPVGDFAWQMRYLGDARASFQYFFPELIPGDPFRPSPELAAGWEDYYAATVKPALLARENRKRLKQWVKTAKLAYDPKHPLATMEDAARQVLGYMVMDLEDARETLGGMPFGNAGVRYRGASDNAALNERVPRVEADAAALAEIQAHYDTGGRPGIPLITVHTSLDPLVPYRHEKLYLGKTRRSKSYPKKHFNIQVERYGHCNLTRNETLLAFAALLLYAGDAPALAGLDASTRQTLLQLARRYRLPL